MQNPILRNETMWKHINKCRNIGIECKKAVDYTPYETDL